MDGGSDHAYELADCLWGTEPEPWLEELMDLLPAGARVLDAGCGEGRNTRALVTAGHRVHAVDTSTLALSHAPELSGPGTVQWEQRDLLNWTPTEVYDGLVLDSVAHWLPHAQAATRVLAKLAAATRPGGLMLLCSFNNRVLDYDDHANPPRTLLPHDTLLGLFDGWQRLRKLDTTIDSSHADVPRPHQHSVTKVLARKN